MKTKHYALLGIIFLIQSLNALGQEEAKKYSVDGYLTLLNTNIFEKFDDPWFSDNMLHNRLNMAYYPNQNWTMTAQLRTRLLYGNEIQNSLNIYNLKREGEGYLRLGGNLIQESSVYFNTQIDRLNLSYQKDNWDIQLGRQRINWGRTLVWNPNDIFNTYSYFDFDYIEKPGADALRVQYYLNHTSSIEFAASLNRQEEVSTALRYSFNLKNYDFQVLLGQVEQEDALFGLGWAGNIKNAGFKGEASYFVPFTGGDSLHKVFITTASIDYIFKNSISVLGQVMYADLNKGIQLNSISNLYNIDMNAKNLAFEEWNFFAQVSYPVTPLLTLTASFMYYPEMKVYFVNPSLSYSLAQNVSASINHQYFSTKVPNAVASPNDIKLHMLFLKLKWNF